MSHYTKGLVISAGVLVTAGVGIILTWVGWESITTVQNGKDISSLTASVGDLPVMKSELSQQGKDIAAIKYYFDNGVLQRLQLEELKSKATTTTLR